MLEIRTGQYMKLRLVCLFTSIEKRMLLFLVVINRIRTLVLDRKTVPNQISSFLIRQEYFWTLFAGIVHDVSGFFHTLFTRNTQTCLVVFFLFKDLV